MPMKMVTADDGFGVFSTSHRLVPYICVAFASLSARWILLPLFLQMSQLILRGVRDRILGHTKKILMHLLKASACF